MDYENACMYSVFYFLGGCTAPYTYVPPALTHMHTHTDTTLWSVLLYNTISELQALDEIVAHY